MATSNLRIEQRAAQPVLYVETETPDIGMALAELLPATFGWVAEHGGAVAGAPYTRYLEIGEGRFRIQAGVPTAEVMQGEGRYVGGKLPGGDIAVGDHHGPYHTVVETAVALRDFIGQRGREQAGPLWENYITDPGTVSDQSQILTEVCYPLV
jgi:effector-binding domain-containing protein